MGPFYMFFLYRVFWDGFLRFLYLFLRVLCDLFFRLAVARGGHRLAA